MNIEDAFEQVKQEIQGECLSDVAEKAGVCSSTLRSWRDNKVRFPRLKTFMKIATYYGYEVTVTKPHKAAPFSVSAHTSTLARIGY